MRLNSCEIIWTPILNAHFNSKAGARLKAAFSMSSHFKALWWVSKYENIRAKLRLAAHIRAMLKMIDRFFVDAHVDKKYIRLCHVDLRVS